jgi:hypothetical protein
MWHVWDKKNECIVFVRKPKGRRPPGRPRHRWEDNIKIEY